MWWKVSKESTQGEWSGDADQNDGYVKSVYKKYQDRLQTAARIGLGDHSAPQLTEVDLNAALKQLKDGVTFLHSG